LRFKNYCAGALFWMYNDTWGEVGWTIIDYYLRRKISFFGVKRAFAPVRLILREKDGAVKVAGCNDTPDEIRCALRVGYMPLDGSEPKMQSVGIVLPARSRTVVYEAALPDEDYVRGLFAAVADCDLIEPAFLRKHDRRRLQTAKGEIKTETECKNGCAVVTLMSPVFAQGVHFESDADGLQLSDNYFDLFPGIKKIVTAAGLNKGDELTVKTL
ncbi:MAG: beta-mannosidase, partial [Defluviitaleaceae bacterium]|nr:beta-mannosidase [Defluviitaleaceae bacterium]